MRVIASLSLPRIELGRGIVRRQGGILDRPPCPPVHVHPTCRLIRRTPTYVLHGRRVARLPRCCRGRCAASFSFRFRCHGHGRVCSSPNAGWWMGISSIEARRCLEPTRSDHARTCLCGPVCGKECSRFVDLAVSTNLQLGCDMATKVFSRGDVLLE